MVLALDFIFIYIGFYATTYCDKEQVELQERWESVLLQVSNK